MAKHRQWRRPLAGYNFELMAKSTMVILRAAAIVAMLFMVACEIPTRISLEAPEVARIPVFRVSGSGSIGYFSVAKNGETPDTSTILWKIEPPGGGFAEITLIGPLTYGIVPAGWVQTTPVNGTRPQALVEGVRYHASADTVNAWEGEGCGFVIKDGRPIQVPPER